MPKSPIPPELVSAASGASAFLAAGFRPSSLSIMVNCLMMALFSASDLPRLATTSASSDAGLRPSSLSTTFPTLHCFISAPFSTADEPSFSRTAGSFAAGFTPFAAAPRQPSIHFCASAALATGSLTFAAGDSLDVFAAAGLAASIHACALAARSASVSSGSASGAGFSATATVATADPARTNSPLSLVTKRTVSSDTARVTTRAARDLPRAETRAAGRARSAVVWEEATANIVTNATAGVRRRDRLFPINLRLTRTLTRIGSEDRRYRALRVREPSSAPVYEHPRVR